MPFECACESASQASMTWSAASFGASGPTFRVRAARSTPCEPIHHEVGLLPVRARLAHTNDVLAVELPHRPRLAEEALDRARVVDAPEHLHGDLVAVPLVARRDDHAHAARADHALDAIVTRHEIARAQARVLHAGGVIRARRHRPTSVSPAVASAGIRGKCGARLVGRRGPLRPEARGSSDEADRRRGRIACEPRAIGDAIHHDVEVGADDGLCDAVVQGVVAERLPCVGGPLSGDDVQEIAAPPIDPR